MATSRPHHGLLKSLRQKMQDIWTIDISAHVDDVHQYLQWRLDEGDLECTNHHKELEIAIKTAIAEAADGM